jgi:hypothetical protein
MRTSPIIATALVILAAATPALAQPKNKPQPIETPQYFNKQKCKANPKECQPSKPCHRVLKCVFWQAGVCKSRKMVCS